ncbi:MAG: hypothetical protein K0S32_1003 [Bacteroidetes bacterium]|jgi:hypothetical protein|nr:hypothetical protein [Bacteroidota bacterium]
MIVVNRFISFSDKNADLSFRKISVQFFNETGGKNGVADKRCLNNKYVGVLDQNFKARYL